jgi:hypothetical protein
MSAETLQDVLHERNYIERALLWCVTDLSVTREDHLDLTVEETAALYDELHTAAHRWSLERARRIDPLVIESAWLLRPEGETCHGPVPGEDA